MQTVIIEINLCVKGLQNILCTVEKNNITEVWRNNDHLTQTFKTSGIRIIDTDYQFDTFLKSLKEMESMGEEQ